MKSRGTDREVLASGPVIIIISKKGKICMLIEVATPLGRHTIQEEAETKLKYKNFSKETQKLWNIKCCVIPVVVGATGIVTKVLKISGSNTRKAFSIQEQDTQRRAQLK